MTLKSVCVCGHFGFGENLLNGQTVKTKIVTEEIERQIGAQEVIKLDTHGGVKALLRLPFETFCALRKCKNIIILPANNGLRVITPILSFYNVFFKRKLHYAVIGGWLASFIKNKKVLTGMLKRFDGIYVETSTMKKNLEAMGFENVTVVPNCKALTVLSESKAESPKAEPYRLCTFSRVMREKGMEDAVQAVKAVNEKHGRTVFTLDIYGQVDAEQTEWFENLKATLPDYVKYGGLVPFDKSVEVLKSYFALLFPTRFYTEGIPGTIIDAYAAGVPVISAEWESFSDMVKEGETGFGYRFGEQDEFVKLLDSIAENPEKINKLRLGCLKEAQKYTPENAIKTILGKMA